jgi:hypothetical protein
VHGSEVDCQENRSNAEAHRVIVRKARLLAPSCRPTRELKYGPLSEGQPKRPNSSVSGLS